MKRIIALLIAVIFVFSLMSFTTSAAVPTSLTIKETKTAPDINDGGKIDKVYGDKLFDIKATDHAKDSGNLFPSNYPNREGERLAEKGVQEAIKVMRNIGYMTYDKENLYIACEVTDVAPKAAANNSEYWRATNLQLTMFVNEELSFPTIAYEGKNKVKVWGDDRSVLDYEIVEASFTEKSQTNYIYEIKIPWKAFPDVESYDDVWSFSMGLVQSSMANGYVCSAFGEGFFLDASKTIPVTLAGLVKDNTANTSSETKTESKPKPSTSSKNETASADKSGDKEVSSNTSTVSSEKETNSSVNAPTTGTDIVTQSSDNANGTTNVESSTDIDVSATGDTTTIITEEADRDWTPIIIIGVAALVIIAGGAVAIILLNKKPSDANK